MMDERQCPRLGLAPQNQEDSDIAVVEPHSVTEQLLRELILELRDLKQELRDQRQQVTVPSHSGHAQFNTDRQPSSTRPTESRIAKISEHVSYGKKHENQELEFPVYRYHWRLPVEPTVNEESEYPEPSLEDQASWLPYIGSNWQIPNDPYTPFKFHNGYLQSQRKKSAEFLREIQQMNQRLEQSGYFKPLVIEDYLDSGETYNYYVHPDQVQDSYSRPELDLEVRPRWRVDQHSEDFQLRWKSPWRRLMTHLAERAITLIMISDQHKVPPPYWNLLAMLPERTYFRHMMDDGRPDTFSAMTIAIKWALENVIDAQMHIQHYFEAQISGENTIFDPEAHDRLLTDDETFSRSKFYFWAINTLRQIDIYMENIIQQVEACFTDWHRLYPDAVKTEDGKLCSPIITEAELKEQLDQLQHIKEDFKKLRNEAIALRDGLFSASAVMESRASTRLGENIRLLTYVSIFFLPLSFCMSLWSINDDVFSLQSLSIVATTVSLATYIAVFNVNRLSATGAYVLEIITGLGELSLRPFLTKIIEAMNKDENVVWQKRATELNTISKKKRGKTSRGPERLSRWRAVQYVIIKPGLFLWPTTSAESITPRNQNIDGATPSTRDSESFPIAKERKDRRRYLNTLSLWKQRKKPSDVELSEEQA
ncbi:hypothetical protein PVAG01_03548 [Phlyctema vagabunda]|uniref:Uncharacterized protein n=1 Tax=Phlyctema vagabunda TaxID=108571 RepID=A0ABR4PMF3_9HELO